MVQHAVPFNRPYVPERSRELLAQSMSSSHQAGDGPMTERASLLLEGLTGSGRIFLTPSCTAALEMACMLANLSLGDEVILPSYNFPSAATAVCMTGATPVFVDVDRTSKNLVAEAVASALTPATKAVIVLHYAGIAADMKGILDVATRHGLTVIEDAAHGLGVRTDVGVIGSLGDLTAYSFHETKNVQCGEGGALQVNDPEMIDRAEILREKGTNRRRFFRGQIDKYSWVDVGSSWLLADPLAAILCGQLEEFSEIQASRIRVWNAYWVGLEAWSARAGFEMPHVPGSQDNSAHMFSLVAPDLESRTALIQHLRVQGVDAAFHYQPLHRSPAGQAFGRGGGLPESDRLGDCLVRLPLFAGMSSEDIHCTIRAVTTFPIGN